MKLAYYLGRKGDNAASQIGDWLICAATRSRFSHVELVTDQVVDGLPVCWSASMRDGMVRAKPIDLASGRWEVVDVDGDLAAAVAWFEAHAGQSYDWLGLLVFISPLDFTTDNRWVCSAAVAAAIGITDPHLQTPDAVYHHYLPF